MTAVNSLPEPPALPDVGQGGTLKASAIPTGIHPSIASEVYHRRALGVVSKTALDKLARSPLHYRSWVDGVDEESTPALEFGSAFHAAVLEPDKFALKYVAQPDFGDCRFKEAKARRDAWRLENAGKRIVSPADYATIEAMVHAVLDHPLAGRMIQDGEPELTASWIDGPTGLKCKARGDYYVRSRRLLVDVKSTLDASPKAFAKSVANYRYHVQDAFYRDGFTASGAPVEHFIFVVVEKSPPYAVALYSLDASAVGRGREVVRSGIDLLSECVRTGSFPGYSTSIQTLALPGWAA